MTIIMFDGSTLEAEEIEFFGGCLVADGYRAVSLSDVERIEAV